MWKPEDNFRCHSSMFTFFQAGSLCFFTRLARWSVSFQDSPISTSQSHLTVEATGLQAFTGFYKGSGYADPNCSASTRPTKHCSIPLRPILTHHNLVHNLQKAWLYLIKDIWHIWHNHYNHIQYWTNSLFVFFLTILLRLINISLYLESVTLDYRRATQECVRKLMKDDLQ